MFSKSWFFSGLLVAGLVVAVHYRLIRLPDRVPRADASAEISFDPVRLDPHAAAPLRIAGAWRLTSREPRLGGVSALAVDRGRFIALTDSGVVIRFAKPRAGRAVALFRDLPAGPGPAPFKANRDSEALARDAKGQGWWVAYENRPSAWLYDAGFTTGDQRIGLGRLGWRANKGAEAMLSTTDALILLPEGGDELVRIGKSGVERIELDNPFGRLADATILPDGRTLLLARTFGPAGFSSQLLSLDGNRVSSFARLKLGRLDNPEAMAAETLPGGTTRLWVITDNDYRRRVPTMLIALDLISPAGPGR